ncbi:MAG TPA: hypothetical protein VNJ71_07215 [Gemmatimonadales bacterium]|nr:hypothetical protein [Gemmatimonadales bacterium]
MSRRPGALPVAAPVPPSLGLLRLHFGTALLWWVGGAAGVLLLSERLAAGAALDPRVLGLTHVFTLGWITTTITGTLYQLFPGLLGVSARSYPVARWTWAALTTGTAVLAGSLAGWRPAGLATGWALLFLAVFLQAWNLLPQRRNAIRNRRVGWYFSVAHMGLGLAMAVALVRIGDALDWWSTPRIALLAAHFHFAALGFVTMTAVGAASRMLPVFLGSQGHPEWPLDWIWRLAAAGLLAFAFGVMASLAPFTWIGAGLMAGAVALFLGYALGAFRHRARKPLDHAAAHLAAAFGWLAVAAGLGLGLLAVGPERPRLWVAYAMATLLGWASLLIAGVLYRVLPAITWNHLYGQLGGRPGMPRPEDLSRPAWGWWSLGLLDTALLVLLLGAALGQPLATRLGAAGYLAGTLVVFLHHARLLVLRGGRPLD